MKVAGRLRLIHELLDAQPTRSPRHLPLHDVAGAIAEQRRAERRERRALGQTVSPVAITGTADAVNEIAVLPSLAAYASIIDNVSAEAVFGSGDVK